MIDNPKLQETFDFFKNVLFEKIIKPAVMGLGSIQTYRETGGLVTIKGIELSDRVTIYDYTQTIYPEFIVTYTGYLGGYRYVVNKNICDIIEKNMDKFYPSREFVFLTANINLIRLDSN